METIKIISRKATFNLTYSGMFTYLVCNNCMGTTMLCSILEDMNNGYQAQVVGDRKVFGGRYGRAIKAVNEDNALLIFGDDFSPIALEEKWFKISKTKNPCIFITPDPFPLIPYTKDNVFVMRKIDEREYSMFPYCEVV